MNNTINKEWVSRKIHSLKEQSEELLFLMKAKQGEDGIITITLKEMAAALKVSVPAATVRLERLIDFGLIGRVDSRSYRLVHTNLSQTPMAKIEDLIQVVSDKPNSSYTQQAEALGITVEELEFVYGFLVYLIK